MLAKLTGLKNELKTLKRLVYRKAYDFSGAEKQDRELTRNMTRYLYDSAIIGQAWGTTNWKGIPLLKYPTDLWIEQEILFEIKPDLLIETGTAAGGSALFLASMMDLIGKGKIMTIDIEAREAHPKHPRIEYVTGSSVDPAILERVTANIREGDTILVILDSDHAKDHVLNELRAYAPLVPKGSYLICEDSVVNGHPAAPHHGPGPMEAIDAFLAENRDFEIDLSREKFQITFNPRGYLKKIK